MCVVTSGLTRTISPLLASSLAVAVATAATATGLTAPVNLLLQHDAIHAGLEQRKHQARFALQLPQSVEDLRARWAAQIVEDGCELHDESANRVSHWIQVIYWAVLPLHLLSSSCMGKEVMRCCAIGSWEETQ